MNRNSRVKRRRDLFRKQAARCRYCRCRMVEFDDSPASCTIDHLIPRSRGGTDEWSNTVAACKKCNNDKGEMTAEEYLAFRAERRARADPEIRSAA